MALLPKNMVPSWTKHSPHMVPIIRQYKVLFYLSFMVFQSKFETHEPSKSKDKVEIANTWPKYGQKQAPI